jgi:hypothetical protein
MFDENVDEVVVARAQDVPPARLEAIVASFGAPVLLIEDTTVHPAVLGELRRLQPTRVVLYAPRRTIDPAVLQQLIAFTGVPVQRIDARINPGRPGALPDP